jgi:CRP-like cAMP-binding protein
VAERSLQAHYAELARIGVEARIEAGQVLWHEGDPGDTVALLLDGAMEVVYKSAESEEEVVLRTLEGGAVVGELAGTDGRARSATVRARTPCRLLKIPAAEFRQLLRRRPDILEELYWLQVERVRSLTRLVSKTHQRAITDPLTGLYNFGFFRERLSIEVDRAAQTGDLVSLVIFDIDHFKNYNDSNGHEEGNVALATVAGIIKEHGTPRRHRGPLWGRGVRRPALWRHARGSGALRRDGAAGGREHVFRRGAAAAGGTRDGQRGSGHVSLGRAIGRGARQGLGRQPLQGQGRRTEPRRGLGDGGAGGRGFAPGLRRRGLAVLAVAALAQAASSSSAEIPNALVVLEVLVPAQPGDVPAAAPPRFVLMEDGTVYVGGTRDVRVGKLESSEQKDLDRRIGEVRKLPLTGVMTVGPGNERRHLFLKKGRALEMVLSGDPADPPASCARWPRSSPTWSGSSIRVSVPTSRPRSR